MKDFFWTAWSFEYALVPCIIAYIIFDLPIIVRRITRRIYVPIYFAFIPAGYSDELLAKYFDEDQFWMVGGPYPEGKMKSARLKIIAISVGSLALTMTLSPLAAGLFGTYALTPEQFSQFIWTLTVAKALLLCWAYYDLRYSFKIAERVPLSWLVASYVTYWVALIYFTIRVHEWVSIQNQIGGFTQVIEGLLDYVILELGVGIVFVSVVGAIVVWWFTEREHHDNA